MIFYRFVCVCVRVWVRPATCILLRTFTTVSCMSFEYTSECIRLTSFFFSSFLSFISLLCTNFRFIEFIAHRFPYAIFNILLLLFLYITCLNNVVVWCFFFLSPSKIQCTANVYIKTDSVLYGFFMYISFERPQLIYFISLKWAEFFVCYLVSYFIFQSLLLNEWNGSWVFHAIRLIVR